MPNKKYNWPQLIADFEASDLNQTAFCQLHEINPKYFNRKLTDHRSKTAGFCRVIPPAASNTKPETGLILEVGQCKIHCPDAMPIESFAFLVRSLA